MKIENLNKAHLEQLLSYIKDVEDEGWYYGNKKYFEIRHKHLKEMIENALNKDQEKYDH